jgi:calcineurin-like phosphoesterase family protein
VDEVFEGPLMISRKILLTHEPVMFTYAYNIHGHDHSYTQFRDTKHLNVCAELINYKPISINQIIGEGRLKNIPNTHDTY